MSKIEEAKEILIAFGFAKGQQNDRSARVLLALAGIEKKSDWKDATNNLIGIHDMIIYMNKFQKKKLLIIKLQKHFFC